MILLLAVVAGAAVQFEPRDFVQPAHCADAGFDMNTYLRAQQAHLRGGAGVSTIAHRTRLHKWTRIGTGRNCMKVDYGDQQITDPDPSGCFPFQIVTERFVRLIRCLNDAIPDDDFFELRTENDAHKFSEVDILSKISSLGGHGNRVRWDDARHFAHMFAPRHHTIAAVAQCREDYFPDEVRHLLQCYPTIMGQPAIIENLTPQSSPLEDHDFRYSEQKIFDPAYNCHIPASCGRLTLQSMHSFQSKHYNFDRNQA